MEEKEDYLLDDVRYLNKPKKKPETCTDEELIAFAILTGVERQLLEYEGKPERFIKRLDALSAEISKRIDRAEDVQSAYDLVFAHQLLAEAYGLGQAGMLSELSAFGQGAMEVLDAYEKQPKLSNEQFVTLLYSTHFGSNPNYKTLYAKAQKLVSEWENADWESIDLELIATQRLSAMMLAPKASKKTKEAIMTVVPDSLSEFGFKQLSAEHLIALYQYIAIKGKPEVERKFDEETLDYFVPDYEVLANSHPKHTLLTEAYRCRFILRYIDELFEYEDGYEEDEEKTSFDGKDVFLEMRERIKELIDKHGKDAPKFFKEAMQAFMVEEQNKRSLRPDDECNRAGYQLKVQLVGISKPPVWRRLQVRGDMSMETFHEVLQVVFDWENRHLYRFDNGEAIDGKGDFVVMEPDEDFDKEEDGIISPNEVTVGEAFSEYEELRYVYDFGDYWEHKITLEKVIPETEFAGTKCLAGRGTTPPEDCGGVFGYLTMKKALTDKKHPDYKMFREWLGLKRGEKFDPDEFYVGFANWMLREKGLL